MNDILRLFVVPLCWLAAFSAVYALHGLGCARGWDEASWFNASMLRWLLIGAWIAAATALTVLTIGLRPVQPFLRRVMVTVGWAAVAAIVWALFPIVISAPCGA